ncbi:MAG: carboxypeptidase-like regulatory domain-containing protein [Gemmatimonas sp.]
MMKHRVILCVLVAGLAWSRSAGAQRGMVPVRGVVFDSLRRQPIRNAFVSMAGSEQVATTDSRGRFHFDSVPPGVHRITAQHPVLDSIGLSGLSAHAMVTDGRAEVNLAVPSFVTLWRIACGDGRVPSDSGIVYGTIRDATGGAAVANAMVELSWSDLRLDKKRGVVQRRWRIETRSNAVGAYAACGVAPELGLQVHAASDSSESGVIDLPPLTTLVERRDLLIGSAATADSARRGTIAGLVTDPSGQALADVRIVIDQMPAIRSDADGRFAIRGVPPGTRQIEFFAIGAAPTLEIADVIPGATTTIGATLRRIPVLDPVRATAERAPRVFATEFAARRKQGFGYVRDSTEIAKYDQFLNVLRDVPSLTVQYRRSTLSVSVPDGKGGSCAPDVLIDGARAGFGNLIDLSAKEVGGVEVYPRAAHIPPRFVPPGIQPECGMILVWTKYGLRNR